MDPTDPVWMQQSNVPPPPDADMPSRETGGLEGEEASGSGDAEFVDFAHEEGIEPKPPARVEAETPRQWLWQLLLPLGFTLLLTLLFLAMRGVMDLGGMVAKGGPYEIAHPAPGYVWIFPVSIMGMILIVFTSIGMFSLFSGKASFKASPFGGTEALSEGGSVSLVALLFWPAIFLSLGWNFCEYGFFKTGGPAWGWVICGPLFVAMGGLPLYFLVKKVSGRELLEAAKVNSRALWPQLIGIAAGIPLGIFFFRAVS